ncbi:MAG TPA: dihydrolipoamide acetyltransferase family protein [Mycobacteriales bacterium]|nr:dihydrolipoamide acetyltransferase family protein [Mycobacteriales bacterium]
MHEVPVRMPKMSMTMTEGEVSSWSVEPGAVVHAGDTICEVLTDKVDMEVESPVDGRLVRITVASGIADVGTPIAWIETEEDDPLAGLFDDPASPEGAAEGAVPDAEVSAEPAPQPAAAQPEPAAAQPQPAAAQPEPAAAQPEPVPDRTGPVPAVPRARALARDAGLDLERLDGSGPQGRVLVADVERFLADSAAARPAPAAATSAASRAPRSGAPRPRADVIRAAVARSMTASAAVPQFTVWRDLDLAGAQEARGRVSWTTLLLRAYACALREVPALLGRWDGERAVPVEQVGVGLAVDTPDGLLVPVFEDPDRVGVEELDADVRASISNARGGRITADHLMPAVATLSNLGGLGVDRFQALVTPPQASVLAVGSIDLRPVAVPGGVGLGLRVTVGLGVDHRVADGAHGARLLQEVSGALADPLRLVGPVRPLVRGNR